MWAEKYLLNAEKFKYPSLNACTYSTTVEAGSISY
jgi:hypothetical protein